MISQHINQNIYQYHMGWYVGCPNRTMLLFWVYYPQWQSPWWLPTHNRYCNQWSHLRSFVQFHWEDSRHMLLYGILVYIDNETIMVWVVWCQETFPHKIILCSVGFLNRSDMYTFQGRLHVFFFYCQSSHSVVPPTLKCQLVNLNQPWKCLSCKVICCTKVDLCFLVSCRWERGPFISEGSPGWMKWLFMSNVDWIPWWPLWNRLQS